MHISAIANSNVLLKATLTLPPGINHSYKIVRVHTRTGTAHHRLAATQKLINFKRDARYCLACGYKNWTRISATRAHKWGLAARLAIYYPDARRRDIDGPIKAILDAAFAYLSLDDRLVVELQVSKFIDRQNPRCEISISLAEEER